MLESLQAGPTVSPEVHSDLNRAVDAVGSGHDGPFADQGRSAGVPTAADLDVDEYGPGDAALGRRDAVDDPEQRFVLVDFIEWQV